MGKVSVCKAMFSYFSEKHFFNQFHCNLGEQFVEQFEVFTPLNQKCSVEMGLGQSQDTYHTFVRRRLNKHVVTLNAGSRISQ